jgi:DNA-directed RNA polymerase specialized sigma24 family protein
MFPVRTNGYSHRALEYASAKDFCRIFHHDTDVLYRLALWLTAETGKAEQCFVAALKECIEGNPVFKEWARPWSRRLVIKNAIRLISPRPGVRGNPTPIPPQEKPGSQAAATLLALKSLQPFDRFVFVISVLEGYQDRDCATLLGCSSTEVISARLRALQQLPREMASARTLFRLPGEGPQGSATLSDVEVA